MSFAATFRLKPGKRVQLDKYDPADTSSFPEREAAESQVRADSAAIDALQDRLYAEGRRSLLVVLQGIDTSGKDGTVRSVFAETGPLGVSVTPFGVPTKEESAHDVLWRVHAACPKHGTIGIFNRSHYEDVLVARVRKFVPAATIDARYEAINAFEKMLTQNGTTILKFMLHISKKKQKKRLQERLDDPHKHWKFNPHDLEDRKLWDEYQEAYALMLQRCSTAWAPWHVIPANHKWARDAAIAAIVRETLERMDPRYPTVDWDPSDFTVE